MIKDVFRHVLAAGGSGVKACSGTTAVDPGVLRFGVAIDDIVPIRSVRILANPTCEVSGLFHPREAGTYLRKRRFLTCL